MEKITLSFELSWILSPLEFNPWFGISLVGLREGKYHKVTSTSVRHDITFEFPKDELPLEPDCRLFIQGYCDIMDPTSHERRCIETGSAVICLSDLYRGDRSLPIINIPLLEEGIGDVRDVKKGQVYFYEMFIKPPMKRPNKYDLVPDRVEDAETLIAIYRAQLRKNEMEMVNISNEIRLVFMTTYNPCGIRLPPQCYFLKQPRYPAPAVVSRLIVHAARVRGWDEATFTKAMAAVLNPRIPLDENQVEALNAFGEICTIVPNAFPYVSDFTTAHEDDTSLDRSILQIVEAFNDGGRRRAADCEDGVKGTATFFIYIRDYMKPKTPLERAIQSLARQYIFCGTLLSVRGAQLDDANGPDDENSPLKIELEGEVDQSTVKGHMRGTGYPVAWMKDILKGIWPVGFAHQDGVLHPISKLPTLAFEPTGPMDSLQCPVTMYAGAGAAHRRPECAHDRFGIQSLETWREPRRNVDDCLYTDRSCNEFYRIDAINYPALPAGWCPQLHVFTGDKRGATTVSIIVKDPKIHFEFADSPEEKTLGYIQRATDLIPPFSRAHEDGSTDEHGYIELFNRTCTAKRMNLKKWDYLADKGKAMTHYSIRYDGVTQNSILNLTNDLNASRSVLKASLEFLPLSRGASLLVLILLLKIT
jgi:hypothetical protein